HYRKVIEIDPNHLQAHLNLGSVYERMKNWEKVLEEIEIAQKIGKETGNPQALSIAERKLKFFKGRMNMTANKMNRKTQPPFD
ncbi:MAG: tetratricopeptide repeat protein, partial [Nitrospinota bacterium]|nr:tetratricopeptide repeat protein [Nitrospinota bacterium]